MRARGDERWVRAWPMGYAVNQEEPRAAKRGRLIGVW